MVGIGIRPVGCSVHLPNTLLSPPRWPSRLPGKGAEPSSETSGGLGKSWLCPLWEHLVFFASFPLHSPVLLAKSA